MNEKNKASKLSKPGIGVRGKLLFSFSLIALTTICASSIGFYSFSQIEGSINRITGESVPSMTTAMALAQRSGAFETSMPLLAAVTTQAESEVLVEKLEKQVSTIAELGKQVNDKPELQAVTARLVSMLDELDGLTQVRIESIDSLIASTQQMNEVQSALANALLTSIDDYGFNLILEAEDMQFNSVEALDQLVNQSLVRLNASLNLKSDVNTLHMVMNTAMSSADLKDITAQSEKASVLVKKIEGYLETIGDEHIDQDLVQSINDFVALTSAEDNLFDVHIAAVSNSGEESVASDKLDLATSLQTSIDERLAAVIDNVYFELVMSAESVQQVNAEGIPKLMDPGVSNLRVLLEYRADNNLLLGLLSEAAQLRSVDQLVPIVERFNAVEASMQESLEILAEIDGGAEAVEQVKQVLAFGSASDGIFALKRNELAVLASLEGGLDNATIVLKEFLEIINEQVDVSKQAVDSASTDSLAVIQSSKSWLGGFAIASLLGTVLLVWLLVSRDILKRLLTVVAALQEIADGKLNSKTEVTGTDEISKLASTVDIFRERALENQRLHESEKLAIAEREKQEQERREIELSQKRALEDKRRMELEQAERERTQAEALRAETDALLKVVQAASKGDLTQEITINGEHPTGQLAEGLETLIESFTQVMNQITATTQIVATGTQEIVNGNERLSQRTNQQSSSLEETAASMLEITDRVNRNSTSAQHANSLASTAQNRTEKVGEIVNEAVTAMNAINDSSVQIAEIVSVIDEIAFQTNLLALNAAVEAARAGEQGRGFAVVASEVRNLAARSGTAAQEIKKLIEDSVQKVDHGVQLVGESNKTLDELQSSVKEVTSIVSEIARDAEHQNEGIQTVNEAVKVLDEMTQQNAEMVDSATRYSTEMAEQTNSLRVQMEFFSFKNTEEDSVNEDSKAA